jgi:hypothetical protein
MTRTAPFFASPDGTVRPFLPARSALRNRPLVVGCAMKKKNWISQREYQDRRESLLKSAFNTQLQPLRSLETVTKKRRALKKKAAKILGSRNQARRLPADGAPGRAFYEMISVGGLTHWC